MEDKKLRYIYQLSLSDGTILINESEGLFSVKNPEETQDRVLINSAVLIKVVEVPQETQEVQAEVINDMPSDEPQGDM